MQTLRIVPMEFRFTIALLRQFFGTPSLCSHTCTPSLCSAKFSGTPSLCSASSLVHHRLCSAIPYTIALLRRSLVHHRFAPPVLWYTIAFAPPVLWYTIALLRQYSGTPSLCFAASTLRTPSLCSASTLVHHRFAPASSLVHHRLLRQYSGYTIALLRQYSGTPSLLLRQYSEHDIPERVELSVFADSQRLHSLAFNFTPTRCCGVAADIADKFPLVPESLSSLASGGQAAADTDRRLGRLADAGGRRDGRAGRRGAAAEEDRLPLPGRGRLLESLAQLLRLTGQPEFWLLGQPEPEGGRTAVQLLRERRFRSLLAARPAARLALEQLDGRASRLQGQEDSVVKVRSWRTTVRCDLVFMTTKQGEGRHPAGAGPQHLPTPGGRARGGLTPHEGDGLRPDGGSAASIEDLLDSQTASAAVAAYRYDCGHFAETDSLLMSIYPEQSMIYPGESLDELLMSPLDESIDDAVRPVRLTVRNEMRSLKQQAAASSSVEHASWSISTSSLIEDAPAAAPAWGGSRTMRRSSILARPGAGSWEWARPHPMESLADDAGSSLALGSGQSPRAAGHRRSGRASLSRLAQQPARRGSGGAQGSKEAGFETGNI
uniref:Protein kinase domain-containing protein n=1 Tax=Macrostomum lignano TaxID=282301 RepID=A0A1I8FKM6_9PLAT